MISGGFRGGDALSFRDSTSCRPNGSILCTILRYPFLVTDPISFLRASSAPIFTNFEGGGVPKKRDFLVKIFQKGPKNAFFGLFFQNLPAAQKFLGKKIFLVLWGSSENQYARPKKNVDKVFEIFLKIPPRKNRRSTPGNNKKMFLNLYYFIHRIFCIDQFDMVRDYIDRLNSNCSSDASESRRIILSINKIDFLLFFVPCKI